MTLNKSFGIFKSDKLQKYFLWAFIPILTLIIILTICNLSIYELNHDYTADTPLYWTVSRGLLNGISPYSGLYENKPVGVFFIYALSFLLTDDIIIYNCFSFLCLLVIAFLPFICTLKYLKKKNTYNKFEFIMYSSISLTCGFLLMVYSQRRGEYFQPEILGAAFICLYFWAIMHIKWKKGEKSNRKSNIIWTILAAIFAMCGVIMKEPFAVIAVAGGLLLVESIRDFFSRIVIPLCIGAVIAISMLLITDILHDYIQIYIGHMFGEHISLYGSPFERALNINKIFQDLGKHSGVLSLAVLIFIVLILLQIYKAKNLNIKARIWKLSSLIIAIFLTSFAVGLGGQYFGHHYVFATPIYMLIIIIGCRLISEFIHTKHITLIALSNVILIFALLGQINFSESISYAKLNSERYNNIVTEAKYVDALLDYYDEDTYQYLGFNGKDCFYGLTKHSPKGPIFVQDAYNFDSEDNWFSQNLIKQLDEVNIVILDEFNMPALNDKVQEILDTEFTTEPTDYFTGIIPNKFYLYTVYYRVNSHE